MAGTSSKHEEAILKIGLEIEGDVQMLWCSKRWEHHIAGAIESSGEHRLCVQREIFIEDNTKSSESPINLKCTVNDTACTILFIG